ncbi:BRI1 kinase inhibitor 1-like [Andrographis paniculata]|uniref:BRI1 kinase inhibitor 1-like n=1 Tax=Andrographis paniculata TaxID=175694 RepID=UPI0021E779E8|nr:BRI1 kinase inhibitor 1-like [Andrographis paniculata]
MDTLLQEMENAEGRRSSSDVQHMRQKVQLSPPPPAASAATSPSHEFSFSVSFPPKNTFSSFAINDLSPADDIFLHGHLLPLHDVLPVSNHRPTMEDDDNLKYLSESNQNGIMERKKSRFLSLIGWRRSKDRDRDDDREDDDHWGKKQRRRSKFDMSSVVKSYMRLMKPIIQLIVNGRRSGGDRRRQRRQPRSFSGNLPMKSKKWELQGEYSAPASMMPSRTNSGLLLGSGITPTTRGGDSTIEELQAAIQAAIAHCKNTLATAEDEDQIKLP